MIAILVELVANPCFEADHRIYAVCEQKQQSIKTTTALAATYTGESLNILSSDSPTFLYRISWSSIDDPGYRYVPP